MHLKPMHRLELPEIIFMDQQKSNISQAMATAESHLPDLSPFLCEGFQMSENRRQYFTTEMLHWKYFECRGPWDGPRSFIIHADGQISAHIGVTTTEFVSPVDPALAVTAVHPVDWLSNQQGGMLGAMLMLQAFGRGTVQYSLGSTEIGQKVLIGAGFKAVCTVPVFHRVFRPMSFPVWRLIHGKHHIPKQAALLAIDLSRSMFRSQAHRNFKLEPVHQFTDEISDLFRKSRQHFVCTSRTPELLNYFLHAPGGKVNGWLCRDEKRLVGFALTSIGERDGIRVGKIVDCFLAETERNVWQSAIQVLAITLGGAGCDVVQTMASVPWFQQALAASGFFPRGRGTFFLRDPGNAVPLTQPFHLTLLDGDQAF